MPHLLFTVTNDLSYDQRMQRIAHSLAGAGYAVTLVGRRRPHSIPLLEAPYRQVRLTCRFDKGKLFYLEYNLRLWWYLLSHPFDLVCAVDLDTLLPGFFVSRLRRKPLVYDAHEYFTEVPEVVRRPLIQRLWRILARMIIPRLRYAYTVGPALAEQLTKRYGITFSVIRNLPEAAPFAPAPSSPGRPVILYQGALNEGRGLEAAITALQHFPGAELWLAGEGDKSIALRDLARRLGVDKRVRFLGFLQPEQLKQLTPKATLGLNLLENRGQSYYYSLANKAFDYIQAGLPSLQMDFPEYRRLQDQYEVFHLLPNLELSTVVAAIDRLLSDNGYRQHLQANCLRAAPQLTWQQEEPKLLAFYQSILPLSLP